MKKRFLSIILALTLVILSVPAMAEEAADSSGEETTFDPTAYDCIELVDFSGGTYGTITETTVKNVALSQKAYDDGKGSILYNFGSGAFDSIMSQSIGDIKAIFADNTDDRANAVVKLRFYSEDIGNKFTICFGKEGITGTDTGYKHATVEVANFGWQEFSVPFTNLLGTDSEWYTFRIDSTGWVNNPDKFPEDAYDPYWTKGDAIYFDSLWFERVPQSFAAADAPSENALVLDGLASQAYSAAKKASATASYTTNLRPGGAPSYTMVNITDAKPKFRYEIKCNGASVSADYDDYKYFNVWIYSPRPQTGGLGVIFSNQTAGKRTLGVNLDWTGWKLVSVDVDSRLTDNESNTSRKGAINKVHIIAGDGYTTGVRAWDSENNTFSSTENAINKGFWNEWNNMGAFGIESAWFSVEKPENANVDPGSTINYSTTTPIPSKADDWVVFDIAKAQALNSNNTPARFIYDSDNGHMYAGSSRTASGSLGRRYFEVTHTDGAVTAVKQTSNGGQINGFYHDAPTTQEAYDARRRVMNEGYTHVNLWMYNPGVRYDQFGNYSEYVLSFECMGTFTADENGAGTLSNNKRIGIGIPANWTGWKLVSIPLSGLSADTQAILEGGIRRIEILSNYSTSFCNDWGKLGTASITDAAIIATITPDCNDADETTNLSRAVSGDYDYGHTSEGVYHGDFNTFCEDVFVAVEKLWFSKEAPASSFGDVTTQSLNNIDVDDEKFDVTFANPVVFVDGAALEAPITELALDYDSELVLGESYTATLPENLWTADGHKYEGKIKFTGSVIDYDYTVDSEAKTVSFDISQDLADKYGDDITLIVAVYSDDAQQKLGYTELALCKVGETASIDYSTFAQYGSQMKVMLWDMGSAYPLIDNIDL